MKIKDLYKVCKKAIRQGNGSCEVVFDSCAMCFDSHLVDIKDCDIEEPLGDGRKLLILGFDMTKHGYPENRTISNKNDYKIKNCKNCKWFVRDFTKTHEEYCRRRKTYFFDRHVNSLDYSNPEMYYENCWEEE